MSTTSPSIDFSQVHPTVRVDGFDCPVISSAFLPASPGRLASHVVIYDRTPMLGAGDSAPFVVALLLHDDDQQTHRLVEGRYDLTLHEAMRDFAATVGHETERSLRRRILA